jgi:2-C-methyl-D-erythritol 4-phosphate cytidylyltransferase
LLTASPKAPRLFALIPSGGTGTRAGGAVPKQFQFLAGQMVLAHTLKAFEKVNSLHAILVVLSSSSASGSSAFSSFSVSGVSGVSVAHDFCSPAVQFSPCAGLTRSETVKNGLQALQRDLGASAHDWVLVHDAARCLITSALIQRLIDACKDDAVGGLLAQPLADTLKQATTNALSTRSISTLSRLDKWLAQTPQMFKIGALSQALSLAHQRGNEVTDEASAMEMSGFQPLLVRGSSLNFKLTYPEDFDLAAAVLACR